jgi:hypothetical protein
MIAQDIELEMRLIDDLLNVARIHLGKLGMAFEIADAYALLHSALGIWANEIADKNLCNSIFKRANIASQRIPAVCNRSSGTY